MQCPKCGKQINDYAKFCEFCGGTMTAEQKTQNQQQQLTECPGYHTLRTIIGIISIVLSVVAAIYVFYQRINSILDYITDNINHMNESISAPDGIENYNGYIIAVLLLTAGIIAIATRKSIGGTITATGFFLVVCILAFFDTVIAYIGYISLIFILLMLLSIVLEKYKKVEVFEETDESDIE